MNDQELIQVFFPSRKKGGLFLSGALILFVILAIAFFGLSSATATGWLFILYLIGGIVSCIPVPMLGYRLFALYRAYYRLDRNSLTLHWGLRTEIIPLNAIEWYRPLTDLTEPMPTPPMPLPGAYMGVRTIEGLGKVEYMADGFENGIIIATAETVFLLSPADPDTFLAAFHRRIEFGSLEIIQAESIQPSSVLNHMWDDRLARNLILVCTGLGLVILLWSILLITTSATVTIGFTSAERVPAVRILLFPVLYNFIFILDLIGGTYFFRRTDERNAAYLLWAGGGITALLLIISLLFTTLRL